MTAWLVVVVMTAIGSPAIVAVTREYGSPARRAARREAARRYASSGYEARDQRWRELEAIHDAVTAPTTRVLPRYRDEPL